MDDEHDPIWPTSVDVTAAREWISSVLPGHPPVDGPITVYRSNAWGVSAKFAATAEARTVEVVLKANFLPMTFTGAAAYELLGRCCPDEVPEIIASVEEPGRRWELFRVFEGDIVGSLGELAPVVDIARTIARIQAAVAVDPATSTSGLPRTPVDQMPAMFDGLLATLKSRPGPSQVDQPETCAQPEALSTDDRRRLTAARSAVTGWADELAAGPWPLSVHHVDLHPNNAVRRPDGTTLIFDWEEADLGFPLFVIDKLLIEAERWWGPAGADAVRAAYLDSLPWSTRAGRERAFDLALLLSPIRYAYADLRFADAMGWDPSPQITTWLSLALGRWQTDDTTWKRISSSRP